MKTEPAVTERLIRITLHDQRLTLLEDGAPVVAYPVSTAKNGPGQQRDSGCTPLGRHRIRIRIGAGCPADTVFIGRRPTGERYTAELASAQPDRDWILARILWLSGTEPGHNRGGRVDSLRRYIYIHGTPDSEPMGIPLSHGCIRMRNADLIALFERVRAGDAVEILA
jgi:L,D-transpeptidase YbiS